jgi:hypothetical protein
MRDFAFLASTCGTYPNFAPFEAAVWMSTGLKRIRAFGFRETDQFDIAIEAQIFKEQKGPDGQDRGDRDYTGGQGWR